MNNPQSRKIDRLLTIAAVMSMLASYCLAQITVVKATDPALNLHQWGAVTIFLGLPSDTVRAIAQTNDGVIWFGTDNGLARFDGRRVQTVALIGATRVTSLVLRRDGALLIATDNGLFIYESGTANAVEATRGYAINDILIGPETYLSTDGGVLLSIDANLSVRQFPAEPVRADDGKTLKLTALTMFGDRLAVGTAGRGVLFAEVESLVEKPDSGRPRFVNAILRTSDGIIFSSEARRGESGIYFESNDGRVEKLPIISGSVSALISGNGSELWAATTRDGIVHRDADGTIRRLTFENTAGGLRSNSVFAIFKDRDGVIWAGTDRGACRFDPSSPTVIRVSDDPNANFVRAVLVRNDGQKLAATNRGIFVISARAVTALAKWAGKPVYGFGRSAAGKDLALTPNGAFEIDSLRQTVNGDVRAAGIYRGNFLAATTENGIVGDRGSERWYGINSPMSLYDDGSVLWVGTIGDGIFLVDGTSAKRDPALNALIGVVVRKITGGAAGEVWIGAENGLYVYRKGELRRIIADTVVRDIAYDGRDLWAATVGSGLVRVRDDPEHGWLTSRLGTEHGIPSEQVFAISINGGELTVGTNRGLASYRPRDTMPSVLLSRVLSQRIHDPSEFGTEIALEFPQTSILIEATGVGSRTFPEQFQYSFVITDDAGRELTRRLSPESEFSTGNLPAGAYVLRTRVISRDLMVSSPATLRFSVARAPFPWTATALGLLLTVVLVALAIAMIERRRLADRNRELRDVKFDLANEAERERSRIARDLHDQTLADLRNLMLMSDNLPTDTVQLRAEIENVSTEIRRICEDLSPSLLQNVGLSAALEFLLHGTKRRFTFDPDPEFDDRCRFEPAVQMQIFRIAQEVVSNITQHSAADSIEMTVGNDERGFELTISENGDAYDPDQRRTNGRGIANIRNRAELIDANVVWERIGERNVFRMRKPVTVEIHDSPT